MLTAVVMLVAMLGAGLMGTWPVASAMLFVLAYLLGRHITLPDVERFSGGVFVLAALGFLLSFFV